MLPSARAHEHDGGPAWMNISIPMLWQWLSACWLVTRAPGSQEGPHDLHEVLELLAPHVVAGARDMGDLELWQLPLQLGGVLRPDDGTAVEVGGDQESGTGDA